jgi:hypothetical protein
MKKFIFIFLAILIVVLLITINRPAGASITSGVVDVGNSNSVRIPSQEFGFYAAGRYWVFYQSGDNADFVYKSTTDPTNWGGAFDFTYIYYSGANTFFAANYDVYFDGVYVHYIYSKYYKGLYYRRGVPQSNGTIAWSAAEQEIYTTVAQTSGGDISLTVDTYGYPWIGFKLNGGFSLAVIKSSTNNGTWSTAFGYPYYFSPLNGCGTYCFGWQAILRPLTSGKIYVVVFDTSSSVLGELAYGFLYNGSTWGSQETISTSKVSNKNSGGFYDQLDVVSIGDDVHVTFLSEQSGDIKYVERTSGSWQQEQTIVKYTAPSQYINPEYTSPVFMVTGSNDLRVFWIKQPVIYYLTYTDGAWDSTSTPITFLTDANIVNDNEARFQSWKETYNAEGGLLYQPTISSVRQQTFLSFNIEQETPTPSQIASTLIKSINIKNNTIFKNNVIFKN